MSKIKKEWWDQIPNPACSPVVAIVIQDPQVSPWEKQPRSQEPRKCPRWKTCLTKLLPCFLEHGVEKSEDLLKGTRNRACPGPMRPVWYPGEVRRTVLLPETISVAHCVELLEAPAEVEKEEEAEEEDTGDKEGSCTSLESCQGSLADGRERIAARLAESMILGLLGAEDEGFGQPSPGEPCLPLPPGTPSAQMPWTPCPTRWDKEQPLPLVIEDNPAYRSFSDFQSQSPGEPASAAHWAEHQQEGDPPSPGRPQPSEPQTWEQILRQRVLQHGTAPAPTGTSCSGYREFTQAVRQGGAPGEAGYKASLSPHPDSESWAPVAGPGGDSAGGGYKPFQNLITSCTGDLGTSPGPLFTFGLDVGTPLGPQGPLIPSCPSEGLSLGPKAREEDKQKPLLPPQEATDPGRDDLASGIVYSALTCHLCGHLKQCHSQEEVAQPHVVASPCCGCCCGDRASPLAAPAGALPAPAEPLPGASLDRASLAPVDISEEDKSALSFQPALSNVQGSSLAPKVAGLVPTGLLSMRDLSYGPSCC